MCRKCPGCVAGALAPTGSVKMMPVQTACWGLEEPEQLESGNQPERKPESPLLLQLRLSGPVCGPHSDLDDRGRCCLGLAAWRLPAKAQEMLCGHLQEGSLGDLPEARLSAGRSLCWWARDGADNPGMHSS